MVTKNEISKIKEETRDLRKKVTGLKESKASIKVKSREKGKQIKVYQERQKELIDNRDKWKLKSKKQEKECDELAAKYKKVADLFEMKEEELKEILAEFEQLKKKYPAKPQHYKP
jgi:chromosome segregation ATPase